MTALHLPRNAQTPGDHKYTALLECSHPLCSLLARLVSSRSSELLLMGPLSDLGKVTPLLVLSFLIYEMREGGKWTLSTPVFCECSGQRNSICKGPGGDILGAEQIKDIKRGWLTYIRRGRWELVTQRRDMEPCQ